MPPVCSSTFLGGRRLLLRFWAPRAAGPDCRTRGRTGFRAARPHLSTGWLPPSPQSLFGKGHPWRWGVALAAGSEPSVQARGGGGAVQDHPGREASFKCVSQAGRSPRGTQASLGYHHTLSRDQPWWASRGGWQCPGEETQAQHGGAGPEGWGCWGVGVLGQPQLARATSSRAHGSLPSSSVSL